jgi:hypothetical protein
MMVVFVIILLLLPWSLAGTFPLSDSSSSLDLPTTKLTTNRTTTMQQQQHQQQELLVSTNRQPQPQQPKTFPSLNFFKAPSQIGNCSNLTWRNNNNNNNNKEERTTTTTLQHYKPVWVASFPGSGAEMVQGLVKHMTGGIPGWTIYNEDKTTNATCLSIPSATCKTHWPVHKQLGPMENITNNNNASGYHSHTILLLRNPIQALPSRLNHLWETSKQVGYHVRQAPEKVWNKWNARNLQKQLKQYADILKAWTQQLPSEYYSVALFVPYEGLTNQKKDGLIWVQRFAMVLQEAKVRVPTTTDSLECLWKRAIWERPQRKRAEHAYVPGFTVKQQQRILQTIQDLMNEFENSVPALYEILQGYNQSIAQDARIIVIPKPNKKNKDQQNVSNVTTPEAIQ